LIGTEDAAGWFQTSRGMKNYGQIGTNQTANTHTVTFKEQQIIISLFGRKVKLWVFP
jgi:hypothetical protein